ncbi:hypothetical protein V3C40_27650 [Janthinobacterium sp. LS2A]|uniref:hypothetical protein n=1 Tax=Janthinobacterium sp. LS2A TaxID=3118590 RepID=UPI002F92D6AF
MKLHELYDMPTPPPSLDEILLADSPTSPGSIWALNEERKWVNGRFERNIGIDQPSHLHGDGQAHAHVLGRRGKELGVVNLDGTASHGTKVRLHSKDADALRARGFTVRADNIVEWVKLGAMPNMIFG